MLLFVQTRRLWDRHLLFEYSEDVNPYVKPNVSSTIDVILNQMADAPSSSVDLRSGQETVHFYKHNNLIYFVAVPTTLSQRTVFSYIIRKFVPEFERTYDKQLLDTSRTPYACQDFESFVIKTKAQLLSSASSSSNVSAGAGGGSFSNTSGADFATTGGGGTGTEMIHKYDEELQKVLASTRKNVADILDRGAKLSTMGDLATQLKEGSQKYRTAAKKINWDLMWQQYGPVGGVGLFIIGFLWWRFFW